MALYRVSYSIWDEGADSSSVELHLNAANEAAALTRAEALGEAIDAVITGEIQKVEIAQIVDTSAWTLKSAAAAGSEIRHGAEFSFRVTGGFITSFQLPTFDQATYCDLNDDVNMQHANIAAITGEVLLNGWADRRGTDIVTILPAVETNGGKRNKKRR